MEAIVFVGFEPDIAGSIKRNALRTGKERIPPVGLFATRKRMHPPSPAEGFNAVFAVRVQKSGAFEVWPWLANAQSSTESPASTVM